MKKKLKLAVIVIGITSIITQLVLIREFLNIFYSNELVLGIIFANWLALTGIGSYLGKYAGKIKKKIRFLLILQTILAFLPAILIYSTRTLRNIFFMPGELINPIGVFLLSFLILLPFCVITGFLLTLACSIFSLKKDARQIGKVYLFDTLGDIIGGLIFSFILIYFLNPFKISFILILINLFSAFIIGKKIIKLTVIALIAISIFMFLSLDLERMSIEKTFQNQEIIEQVSSKYGTIIITKTSGQLNFFENGRMLFSTENTISNEETVHYAMIQHENQKKILLISGGVAGTLEEILKYKIEKVDYLELDPKVIELGKKYTSVLENNRINIITQDGRLFIKETEEKYDVVIIDLPDPSTIQINRFYTIEFFQELKKKLNKKAIVSLSISSSENYMSEEAKKFNSVIYNTLQESFQNIIIIPGDENFYIASDSKLSYDIANMIEQKGIDTKYVNKYYLVGKLTKDRINYVEESVKKGEKINKDFNPAAYYYNLLFWKTQFNYNISWLLALAIIIILLFMIKIKPVTASIATIGFSAISLELIIISGFQIIYGYVYSWIGVIITLFLIGIALGAYYMNKTLQKKSLKDFLKIQFMIAIYSALLPIILIVLSYAKNEIATSISANIIIPILAAIIGFFTGSVFPLASKITFKNVEKTASTMYSADLIGACIGAILTTVFLVPLLGIFKVCIIISGMNVLAGIIVWKKR